MPHTHRLHAATSAIALWAVQNPTAARLILLVAPILVAVVMAALAHQPVYACPSIGSGGCGGDT
ncbi:MAG: hypothetical protein IT318_18370 [Anaerolineales bacterium]|nr:hypothetical protein [Anaerolineales bacterium]